MRRLDSSVAIALVLGILVTFASSVLIRGELQNTDLIADKMSVLADTDRDGILTTREIRIGAVTAIRRVAVSDPAFDVNEDGVVSYKDISDAVRVFRIFAAALCGDGRVDFGEQCDDANTAAGDGCSASCDIEETYSCTGRLSVCRRPARITYLADIVDDFNALFFDAATKRYRNVQQNILNNYFSKLRDQGLTRLIVYQSGLPLLLDPETYYCAPDAPPDLCDDWMIHKKQMTALIESDDLRPMTGARLPLQIMRWRLTPDLGSKVSAAARAADIELAFSFHPFEAGLNKYESIPVFDENGRFLWQFYPHATPELSLHPERVGMAHYRTIFASLGAGERAELDAIQLNGVADPQEILRAYEQDPSFISVTARHFPPLQETAFILQRQSTGDFALKRFRDLPEEGTASDFVPANPRLAFDAERGLVLSNIGIPDEYPYIVITDRRAGEPADGLVLSAADPVRLWSAGRTPLGRTTVYWSFADRTTGASSTRVASYIDSSPYIVSEFYAVANSKAYIASRDLRQIPLRGNELVIDRGTPWSTELLDFQRPDTRALALRQIRAALSDSQYAGILINSRSHTDLAGGLDQAYAPISIADDDHVRALAASDEVSRITESAIEEWKGTCQTAECEFPWRYNRNLGVAAGIRDLLHDVSSVFPQTGLQIVLPETETATRDINSRLDDMLKPDGTGTYGSAYYRQMYSSLNYLPVVAEGLAMLDLSGLPVRPVFNGFRFLPERDPFFMYLTTIIRDMAGNRDSSFIGPRSLFYEAQETLHKGKDGISGCSPDNPRTIQRQLRICAALQHTPDIDEIILYEALDWYRSCDRQVHDFLAECPALLRDNDWLLDATQ